MTLLYNVLPLVDISLTFISGHYDTLSSLLEAMLCSYKSAHPFSAEKVIFTEFFLRLVQKQRDSSLQ